MLGNIRFENSHCNFYLLNKADKDIQKKNAIYFIREQNMTSYVEYIRYITATDKLLRNIRVLIPRKDEKNF